MQTTDAVVRLQNLSGTWETCGVDRLRGIRPEGLQLDADSWGPASASFTLRRDPGSIWPDLLAFTPVEIEIGGVLVWSGFIKQTPSNETDGGSINVQCAGWQYHLDDDSFEKVWVISSTSAWRDARSFTDCNISYFPTGPPQPTTDNGTVTIGWASGNQLQANTHVGVILDVGPENKATGVSIDYSVPKNISGSTLNSTSANVKIYGRASDSISSFATVANDAWTATAMPAVGASGSLSGAFPATGRYVLISMAYTGTSGTSGANYMIKLNGLRVTTDATYTSGAITGQTASQVIKDCLVKAPLLNQSTAGVTATTFSIPQFGSADGGKTPREYINNVNSYHDYVTKITADKRLIFKPQPSAPSVAVGKWGGATFEDASSNSSEEIYNKVVVEGTSPSGDKMRVTRYPAMISGSSTATPESVGTSLLPGIRANAWRVRATGGLTSGNLVWVCTSDHGFNAGDLVTFSGWTPAGYNGVRIVTQNTYLGATDRFVTSNPSGLDPTGTDPITTYGVVNAGSWAATTNATLGSGTLNSTSALQWSLTAATSQSTITATVGSGYTFKAGVAYTLSFSLASNLAYTANVGYLPSIKFGITAGSDYVSSVSGQDYLYGTISSPRKVSITWTPLQDYSTSSSTVQLVLTSNFPLDYVNTGTDYYLLNQISAISNRSATMADRRGFFRTKRLQVSSTITQQVGQTLGDVFLTSHMTTPLKGTVTVNPGGVRDYLSGATVHPSQLLPLVGEKLHLSHRTNPDNGAQGRDGFIASVSYSHDTQSASVSIDNQRNRFEALLERLAVVSNTSLGQ
jgi:hypothetical protein